MKATIYYTDKDGIDCDESIEFPMDYQRKPSVGSIVHRFHLSRQLAKRKVRWTENGRRRQRTIYERGLRPEDYSVYKVVLESSHGWEGKSRITYDNFKGRKTPDVYAATTVEFDKYEQEEMNL